jgi:MoaA/NifB/PqqE/SkfB family radical SAM enzyme
MSEPKGAAALPAAGLHYVSWEITRRCDARCIHCYAESGPEVPTDGDLSTAEALALIDQLAAGGEMILALSGGEPLLRPDWRELVRHAVERDLIVSLVTNGSQVDDRVAADLAAFAARGLQNVTVSLDSHLPEVHDRIRRLPGLHARALGAIRRLAGRGVRVVVNFTPIRDNRRDARGVVELAYQLGAAAVSLSEYAPSGRGTREMALSAEEAGRLAEEWVALAGEYRGRVNLIADRRTAALLAGGPRADSPCPDCGAGRVMARVTAAGDLTPCAFVPRSFGSLRSREFAELWTRSRPEREAMEADLRGECCSTCGMLLSIGG